MRPSAPLARSTPSSAPARCVTLTPPTHPPTHPPSRAPAGPRSQVKMDAAKNEKDRDKLLKLANSNGSLQCDVPTKARVCVWMWVCVCVCRSVLERTCLIARSRAHTHTQ